jgi:predicted nucleic acid-binding protein
MIPPDDDYLFDTTVFDDYLRGRLVAQSIFQQARMGQITIGYSIITEAELWAGIRPPRTFKEHEDLLRPFKRYFINVTIARRAGELRADLAKIKHQRIPGIADCLIAATGEYYGLTVCSRNTRDFTFFTNYAIKVVNYLV